MRVVLLSLRVVLSICLMAGHSVNLSDRNQLILVLNFIVSFSEVVVERSLEPPILSVCWVLTKRMLIDLPFLKLPDLRFQIDVGPLQVVDAEVLALIGLKHFVEVLQLLKNFRFNLT